jgi:ribosome-binding protein aMBF1 (putative translation factor)
MNKKLIGVEESFAQWRKDPAYQAAYDALDEEFTLASTLIAARSAAGISQEEIARRMQTSQPAIARLESGKANPSVDTLRRYAAATGTQLKIVFEPGKTANP